MRTFIITFLIFLSFLSYGHSREFTRQEVHNRLNKTSLHHLGIGMGMEMNRNNLINTELIYRYGNKRQTINSFCFIEFSRTFPKNLDPCVSFWQYSMGCGISENIIKSYVGTLYLAESVSIDIPFSARYHDMEYVYADKGLVKFHLSGKIRLGFALNNFDVSLFSEFDMMPTFNQKYIFETIGYDYYAIRSLINERFRLGVSIVYFINF